MSGARTKMTLKGELTLPLFPPDSHRDVAPYLNEAYVQSLAFGSASYGAYVSHVHPLVVRSLRETQSFYVNHFDPAIRRAYALYIRPQMDKVLAKMFGHKAQAAGSDALKAAKQGAKQVRKDAKVAEKEKVAEAVRANLACLQL